VLIRHSIFTEHLSCNYGHEKLIFKIDEKALRPAIEFGNFPLPTDESYTALSGPLM